MSGGERGRGLATRLGGWLEGVANEQLEAAGSNFAIEEVLILLLVVAVSFWGNFG